MKSFLKIKIYKIYTEKYITFTVLIEKEITRIVNNGEEVTKNISYLLQLVTA